MLKNNKGLYTSICNIGPTLYSYTMTLNLQMIMPANIYVNLVAENTQHPTFTSGTYNFVGVPQVRTLSHSVIHMFNMHLVCCNNSFIIMTNYQTLTPGVDITNQEYGNPITATDTDNNFGAGNYDGAITEFEIEVK